MQTRMVQRGRAAPGLFKGSAIADDGIKHNIAFRAAIFPRPGNQACLANGNGVESARDENRISKAAWCWCVVGRFP
jgi:hypothetical protein